MPRARTGAALPPTAATQAERERLVRKIHQRWTDKVRTETEKIILEKAWDKHSQANTHVVQSVKACVIKGKSIPHASLLAGRALHSINGKKSWPATWKHVAKSYPAFNDILESYNKPETSNYWRQVIKPSHLNGHSAAGSSNSNFKQEDSDDEDMMDDSIEVADDSITVADADADADAEAEANPFPIRPLLVEHVSLYDEDGLPGVNLLPRSGVIIGLFLGRRLTHPVWQLPADLLTLPLVIALPSPFKADRPHILLRTATTTWDGSPADLGQQCEGAVDFEHILYLPELSGLTKSGIPRVVMRVMTEGLARRESVQYTQDTEMEANPFDVNVWFSKCNVRRFGPGYGYGVNWLGEEVDSPDGREPTPEIPDMDMEQDVEMLEQEGQAGPSNGMLPALPGLPTLAPRPATAPQPSRAATAPPTEQHQLPPMASFQSRFPVQQQRPQVLSPIAPFQHEFPVLPSPVNSHPSYQHARSGSYIMNVENSSGSNMTYVGRTRSNAGSRITRPDPCQEFPPSNHDGAMMARLEILEKTVTALQQENASLRSRPQFFAAPAGPSDGRSLSRTEAKRLDALEKKFTALGKNSAELKTVTNQTADNDMASISTRLDTLEAGQKDLQTKSLRAASTTSLLHRLETLEQKSSHFATLDPLSVEQYKEIASLQANLTEMTANVNMGVQMKEEVDKVKEDMGKMRERFGKLRGEFRVQNGTLAEQRDKLKEFDEELENVTEAVRRLREGR